MTVIRPTYVQRYIIIKLEFAELWLPKSSLKCPFLQFLEVILTLIFARTTNFEYSIFCAHQCTLTSIIRIFGASQVLGSFRFDSVFSPILVVFGQYCLSLRAIISIIKRDNRLLDGCFGKLKRLPISNISSIFKLNAEFWPKNLPENLSF